MTGHSLKRTIAFLGNYLPRRCGIATFTTDLAESVTKEMGDKKDIFTIAMTNIPEGYKYPDRVKFEIRQNIIKDYEQAADFINTSKVDCLCIQHEFGIFGGQWGDYLNSLLKNINVPVVTTLHTVLETYQPAQEQVLKEIITHSDKIIVLSKKAINMLKTTFLDTPKNKIVYIPHGIPDLPFVDSNYYKDQFDLAGKTIIFTFGLLGPGKGIEYMIQAMPKIIEKYPDIVYIVLGVTHPDIFEKYGEEYRLRLLRQIKELGLTGHVQLHDKFVSIDELKEYLCASDFYAIPYLNKEQIISGTMAYAMGAGKAVISTGSWCAEEMLSKGRGKIIPFKDPDSFVAAIDELMKNKIEFHRMRKRGYQFGRDMVWSKVAKEYVELFEEVEKDRKKFGKKELRGRKTILSTIEFPTPKLDHIKILTDDFAMFQHAMFTIPNYQEGYCVDDNARACVVALKYYKLFKDHSALALLRKYLAFLIYAQMDNGRFRNFYDITKKPLDEGGSDDCQGRALWGLGYVVANAPDFFWITAKACFDKAVTITENLNLRGSAYSIMGIYYYLKRYPGALQMRSILEKLANKVADHFNCAGTDKWKWFEKTITYSNGLIPLSMWISYDILKEEKYRKIAETTTDFLIEKCLKAGRTDHISLVGCHGWMEENDAEKPDFDQQPLDAMYLVELCRFAYNITENPRYLNIMSLSFNWFMGVNDLDTPLYDLVTGGCYDGLTPDGPNLNQGAESTLSAVLSLLSLTEMAQKEPIKI